MLKYAEKNICRGYELYKKDQKILNDIIANFLFLHYDQGGFMIELYFVFNNSNLIITFVSEYYISPGTQRTLGKRRLRTYNICIPLVFLFAFFKYQCMKQKKV